MTRVRWPRLLLVLAGTGVALMLGIHQFRPDWLLEAEFQRLEWLASMTPHATDAAMHRIAYETGGTGETIVLVHGFSAFKETWFELARELTPRYRVIAPDLPGWGASQRIDGADYDVSAQADRLLQLFDALDLDRVHLVGHSMGGHIAGVFAARHPERLLSLTLMNSAGVRFEPNAFVRRVLAGEAPFNYSSPTEFHAFMHELFVSPRWLPPRVVDELVERNVRDHAFQAALLKVLSTGPNADLLQRSLPDIRVPTLVFWCRGDALLDVSSVPVIRAGLTDAPRVETAIVEQCSHMPMMEKPRETGQVLAGFLDSMRG